MAKMEKIYFSIIMPNYNKANYIATSINSVLNQTYPFFELIIVDDGSTDDSLSVLESFSDKRIKLIRINNSGAAAARNTGIESANYGLIAFIDSDDIWLPHFLGKMVSLIKRFPEAGAYSCAFLRETFDGDNPKKYKGVNCSDSQDYIIENYFESVLDVTEAMTASTTVVKKCVFDQCGMFPVGVKNWEDFDMWIRIALYFEVCYTTCICAVYNDVPNSASRNKTNLYAPVFENYKMHIKKSGIKGKKKKAFRLLVAKKEGHAAYEQYLVDHNGMKALRRVIPFLLIRFKDKTYWSAILQFIFTPERVLKSRYKKGSYGENNTQD